ncbi:unnamed protein product [Caenorhabditis angaria]|uniref:G-protein coupled receptors family 1 profile domain-containing protein n=1 Tax=Caenorhabditis angaria TaxID=860376 RepID=A0A9P1IXG9_9PELO|nr:unnamed protein product [Caenorhabditis angaria]
MEPLALFIQCWHTVVCCIGFFLNGLLIYLCIFKSPKTIQSFATFIINFALNDLVECFFDMFLAYRVVPTPGTFVIFFVYNGFCTSFGQEFCKIGNSIFLHCLPHGLWSLLVSFAYRLYIFSNTALSRTRIVQILLIVYIPSFAQIFLFAPNFSDQETAQSRALKYIPQYDLRNKTIASMSGIGNWSALYSLVHICAPIYPVYIAIFIIRRKIIQKLESVKIISKETKSMHQQLLKCLTFQAFIPVFLLIGVCLYLICQFAIFSHPIIENAVFCIVIFMPTLSPVTYLYFVRPYRLFFKKPNEIASRFADTTRNTNSQQQMSKVEI